MHAQLRLAPSRATRALVQRRLLNTSAPLRNDTTPVTTPLRPVHRRGKSGFRRFVFWTAFGVAVFYPLSGYVSTKSEAYRDLFVQVPGGEAMAEFADENDWDQFGVGSLTKAIVNLTSQAKQEASNVEHQAEVKAHEISEITRARAAEATKRAAEAKASALAKAEQFRQDVVNKVDDLKHKAAEIASQAKEMASDVKDGAVETADQFVANASKTAEDLAEIKDAVAAGPVDPANRLPDTARPRQLRPETVQPQVRTYEGQEVYGGKLPLGFEAPPGYYIPPPKAKPKAEEGDTLPQLVTQVKEIAAQEPIIAQLASTIDSLTKSLSSAKGGASADASDILVKAQGDLSALNARLDEVKKTEQAKLEKTVSQKQADFEAALRAKQSEWEKDEAGLKEEWHTERQKMVDGWRSVLDNELNGQREEIEKRLHDEVVSQGIELQRRWLRSIKSQVETERGGRLAKLDSLTTSLKHLERITLDNSAVLDDNVRLHKVWSALRAVQTKVEHGDQSFDDELRVLQGLTKTVDEGNADKEVVNTALAQLEASGIAQTGVKSFTALSSWFSNAVAPRIHSASLVPKPEDATVLSHLASMSLSKLLFRPKAGLVDGNDVGAVLARAEYALSENDLDAAAREVNSLRGWPRKLAEDWLREARRKLEAQQVIDIVGTQATLSSLLMV